MTAEKLTVRLAEGLTERLKEGLTEGLSGRHSLELR